MVEELSQKDQFNLQRKIFIQLLINVHGGKMPLVDIYDWVRYSPYTLKIDELRCVLDDVACHIGGDVFSLGN